MCKVRLTTLCDTALKFLQTVLAKQKNVCDNIFTSISLNLFLGDFAAYGCTMYEDDNTFKV